MSNPLSNPDSMGQTDWVENLTEQPELSLECLFCEEKQMEIYWLPDSDPAVCHVACKCGASGPWAESVTEAVEKYVEVAAMLE